MWTSYVVGIQVSKTGYYMCNQLTSEQRKLSHYDGFGCLSVKTRSNKNLCSLN